MSPMANQEHVETLKRSVGEWNGWRETFTGSPDLSGAYFRGADLAGANLSNTNLHEAKLSRANLHGANLNGAKLTKAYLNAAVLGGASLHAANLRESNLIWANLSGADLTGADFTGAAVGWTIFGNLDLSVAKGIDGLIHYAPSTVGINTVYGSQGKIPSDFLRGVGVPE